VALMTVTSNLPAIRTQEQRKVLVRYAAGETVSAIIAATNLNKEFVTAAVADLAKFDRGRARELVQEYDQRAATVAASKVPRPSKPAPAPEPTPAPAPKKRPVIEITDADPIDELLERGARSYDARARHLTKKARDILTVLADRLTEVAAEQQRRDERAAVEAAAKANVEKALAALEAARAELAEVTGKTTPPPAASDGPSPRDVRAWAREAGVDCPPLGRIPRTVMDAWKAAHQ
jgi:hypothetical protein